ncbi:MAG: hypothetical protein NC420_06670 [Eubacterium sp.]|nr:hypothetical protein [Eubacterium sp.]MCM1305561.1 hypothetical protein [Butyrivibrio sp.]MCM1409120.1 hypothetical protein [Lachnospiraceae bacterium]
MISLAMTMALGMTACGNEIPDMTDAQMQAIGEYAAAALMRYDVDHQSRLVDLELVAQEEARRKELAEAEALRREQEEAAAQEEGGMRPTADTPVIGADGMPESEPLTMEEVLDLPEGVTITYREMAVCDSYPDGDESFFSLAATEGKRLLVLKFDLYNGSGQDQLIDILSQGAIFKVTVNGNVKRNAMTTMLLDDLTDYKDTIGAGSSVEAVLIVEVEGSVADGLSSLSLELKNDSKTYAVQFF